MGREVRKVPSSWEHPKNRKGSFIPLFDGKDYRSDLEMDDYMPTWNDKEADHYMMYETCSEGTPISPAFATPEELARYCADNNVSAFGNQTASYEAWLRVANGGFACSVVSIPGIGIVSGVEALNIKE